MKTAFYITIGWLTFSVAALQGADPGPSRDGSSQSPVVGLGTIESTNELQIDSVSDTPAASDNLPPGEETDSGAPDTVEQTQPDAKAEKEAELDSAYHEIALLTEALLHIRRSYVEELSYSEILYGALDGMLQSLDPYSQFMTPEEFDEFEEDSGGLFTGVGLQIGVRDGGLVVIAPIDGSPAFRAGIIAGDRILRINGEDAYELSVREAATKLRGKDGQEVTLTLGRSKREPFEISITREVISIPSVRSEKMPRPGLAYLRITKFDEQTMPALREKLDGLKRDGMKALILDLRSNPGGLLKMAVSVAEQFLERGKVVVSIRGRDQNGTERKLLSGERRPFTKLPLVVLVDGGSASAAEVVAGALQDHRRAVIFGERTFGKASVQSVIPLTPEPGKEDCGIRLTTAHYHTPNGRMIHKKGIDPDVAVELTAEQRANAQMRRSYEETPGMDEAEVPESIRNAPDIILDRALDLLAALVTLGTA